MMNKKPENTYQVPKDFLREEIFILKNSMRRAREFAVEHDNDKFYHAAANAYEISIGVIEEALQDNLKVSNSPPFNIPKGWKLVPVEPTRDMIRCGWNRQHPVAMFQAMVANAPECDVQPKVSLDVQQPCLTHSDSGYGGVYVGKPRVSADDARDALDRLLMDAIRLMPLRNDADIRHDHETIKAALEQLGGE